MNNHKTVNINIQNQTISVDEEMANVVIALNDLGFKTSGCCIGSKGDDSKDEAWIIIQETNENKIIELMNMLNNCSYTLEKQLYKKNSDNIIYVQYTLKTPKGGYFYKVSYIEDWFDKLIKTEIYHVQTIYYECMEKLFEPKWTDIIFENLFEDYKDTWKVQYKLSDNDSKGFEDKAVKEIKEYIEKNFVDVKSVNLGDKEIYIIPNPTDKPVKIIYENNGCDNCKEMQIELKKRKLNEMDIEVYECSNCGREFFV